jgi:hypothetical protein
MGNYADGSVTPKEVYPETEALEVPGAFEVQNVDKSSDNND